jgi:hypothetical protein
MKSEYRRGYSTIGGKMLVALICIAVMPCLLLTYMVLCDKIQIAESIVLYVPLILFSILAGYALLRKTADDVFNLSRMTGQIASGKKTGRSLFMRIKRFAKSPTISIFCWTGWKR